MNNNVRQFNDQQEKNTTNSSKPKNIWPKIILGAAGCIVIFCVLAGLGMAYQTYGLPYFGPKTTVILEPDVPQNTQVSSSDLESTAKILSGRCRLLGVSSASFTVSANGQIVGQIPRNVDTEKLLTSIKTVGTLEFVDFVNEAVPEGTQINTDFGQPFPPMEGKKWHTIMTNKEIQSVTVITDQNGRPAIGFTLTPDGTQILSAYTTKHVGDYLGIVLDKMVISAPRVNAPITNGEGMISGSFTMDQANSLAVYLKYGSLPVPLKVIQVSNDK